MSDSKLKLEVILATIDRATAPLKKITAGGKDVAAALKETRDALKTLDRQQAAIQSFRDTQKQSSITANELKTVQARVKALKLEMLATSTPTKAMTKAFSEAKAEASALRLRHDQLIERAQKLRSALAADGIETAKLAEHQRRLAKATGEASEKLKAQQATLAHQNKIAQARQAARVDYSNAMRSRNAYASAGTTLGLAAGATMAGLSAPVNAFAAAEDAATGLRAALMDARGQIPATFNDINDLATSLGNRLPGTTADYQNMMTMLIRQGMSAKTILGGLGEATAYLGVQLKMPMDQAAEFAAKLQDATKTTEQDMMGLMDTIQRTYYLGVDSDNMLQAFAKLTPAMDTIRKTGLAGAQALAPLVVMADQAGMRGESVGNAYRKLFQLSMDADKVAKGSKLAGIDLNFSDGKGEFGGLDNLFAQLDKLKSLNTETRLSVIKAIFGDDAETLQVVSLMIEKGAAGYADVQQKMVRQASLQQRVNQQLGTLRNLWDAASGTFTNALVVFGEAIAPDLKRLTSWIGDVSERLGKWSRAHPELTKWIMRTAAALGVLFAVTSAIALLIAAVVGPFAMASSAIGALGGASAIGTGAITALSGAFGLLKTGILVASRALLTTPIGLILAALAFLIYKYWEPISAFFVGVWDGFVSGIQPAVSVISQLHQALRPVFIVLQPLVELIASVVSWFIDLIAPVSLTTEQFNAATNAGRSFGQVLAAAFNLALVPIRTTIALVGVMLNQLSMLFQVQTMLSSGNFGGAWELIKKNVMGDAAKLLDPDTYLGKAPGDGAPYRPVMAAGAGGGAYAPTYHITLPPTSSGSPKDHAAAVADELDKRERARKAQMRAKLGDHD